MKTQYENPVILKVKTGMTNPVNNNLRVRTDIDGVTIDELVAAHGSPLFVFSEATLRQRYRDIYNAYSTKEDAYFSKIVNLNNGTATRVCQPIYSVDPQGRFALTLDFSRLARLRPDYGYFNKKAPEELQAPYWLHITQWVNRWEIPMVELRARLGIQSQHG